MAMSNAEKQKAWRERQRAKGQRPDWVREGERKVFRIRIGPCALTLTRLPKDGGSAGNSGA
jgi:hypothetical protein